MSLTRAQQEAVAARGNVLVVAGAGTGKTRTLVERCLDCLLHEQPRASVDELLMVTFAEAAAAEMRQRIRERLEAESARQPGDPHWQEQLALFETAHIGTLHSFCLRLVRQHFYELELDPQLTVMPEEEARLLAEETLEDLLQKYYGGSGAMAAAVQQLIQVQGRGRDRPLRQLVLRLHHYTQTLPNPAGWMREQLASFASEQPHHWVDWLAQALRDWRQEWLPVLKALSPANPLAEQCFHSLTAIIETPVETAGRVVLRAPQEHPQRAEDRAPYLCSTTTAAALDAILAVDQNCPIGKKGVWLDPLKTFMNDAAFLASLLSGAAREMGDALPPALVEDWRWVRDQMSTLLQLAGEFSTAFTEAKRELGVVDFHDLEQYALKLLWDGSAGCPTRAALQWREKLRFIFVDEYQDINAAQDKIIEALSREGAQANRFLVGDVKQSIYRFRLANPAIFQGYIRGWSGNAGKAVPLQDNFRSRREILDFINSLFGLLMQPELGGVPYDEKARLNFASTSESPSVTRAPGSAGNETPTKEPPQLPAAGPCVELHLKVKGAPDLEPDDEAALDPLAGLQDLDEADKEARLVALRLRELQARQHPVWDEKLKQFRPVEWRDMAILLRSPSHKAECYAKEFSRLGLPLQVARRGFYQSLEISDLLSLLKLLDNPLQDLPVLAVLHSPLVGLTVSELAEIRLAQPKTHFWSALLRWAELQSTAASAPAYRKVATFLGRYAKWRRLARRVSLSRCLEGVLGETHYADWLLTQPRGAQRQANLQGLLVLAGQFDQFQRQGLFRFLRFIDAQQSAETEPEVSPASEENAVRLMSIHQSKGLEFPVVVLADVGKLFNLSDLRADLILDDQYGLCPQIKPPHTGKRYPSLPHWLARRRQTRELLGEELRLLYVALTRARDTLILTGIIAKNRLEELRNKKLACALPDLLAARRFADWLGIWFSRNGGPGAAGAFAGENAWLSWVIHNDSELVLEEEGPAIAAHLEEPTLNLEPEILQELQQRLSWQYAYRAATRQPAKTSVSALRRQAGPDEEAARLPAQGPGFSSLRDAANAAEAGSAAHLFLQWVALEQTDTLSKLKKEVGRLQAQGTLTREQVDLLELDTLAAFWNSELGRNIRAQAPFVRRELAFTARFAPDELVALTGQPDNPSLRGEFLVVQGVADLVVLSPNEIWLVDFKTDRVPDGELGARAASYELQLRLYSKALAGIYRRPVSQCWLYFLAHRRAVPVQLQFQQTVSTQLRFRQAELEIGY